MTHTSLRAGVLAFLMGTALTVGHAQQPPPAPPHLYPVGNPLGLPITPSADGGFKPVSPNVKVYGSVYSAESCSYDPDRNLIVVPNRGVPQNVQTNNAWLTLLNHDGSIHTARWIGVQAPGAQRDALNPPLVLNEPYGSDIVNGVLYLADRDGGATPQEPSVSVIRRFNMKTGTPAGETRVSGAAWFNDIAVTQDGTVYATVTGAGGQTADASTWQVWRVLPNGQASIFLQGAPLNRPNGIALDPEGHIVVANTGDDAVITLSHDAKPIRTERAAQPGSDGLVIMTDGTKYVSSVTNGGVSRIRPGRAAELIAENIPNAASMCYDAGARQLVIPMNANNALAFVKID
jgi:outer membrane protein assembly factor BamB